MVKTPTIEQAMTKRSVVSSVAQLYDPNGFIAPVTIIGKIIIQDIWRLNVGWDETLPIEIYERWREFRKEITFLENVRIQRWIGTSKEIQQELHGFSDASERAYGAAIYVRTICANGRISASLLTAKTRVAPLKTVTIPRLELAAAELLGRLVASVIKTMEWAGVEYELWSDSLVALHWINKLPYNLKIFVANRVASIQRNTEVKRWRHVRTQDNPADLLSRGIKPSALVNNKLWLHGPEWLAKPRSSWSSEKFVPNVSDGGRDEMKVLIVTRVTEPLSIYVKHWSRSIPLIEYTPTLEKAINIISYVLRFVNKTKAKVKKRKEMEKRYGKRRRRYEQRARRFMRRTRRTKRAGNIAGVFDQPSSEEKMESLGHLLKKEQEKYFSKEIACIEKDWCLPEKSRIESLKPILDGKMILRVGGRLERAEMEYERRHPAIVPNGSRLAWLIMHSAHSATKHGAVQVMMQHILDSKDPKRAKKLST